MSALHYLYDDKVSHRPAAKLSDARHLANVLNMTDSALGLAILVCSTCIPFQLVAFMPIAKNHSKGTSLPKSCHI